MKNWRNWIVILALVVYVILFWWWASAGYPTEAKICNPPASTNNCESHNILFALAVVALDKLNFYGVLITAIATGVIGYFTYTLKQSTDKLWRASEDQLDHAKNEAMSDAMRRLKEEARLQEQTNIARDSANAAKQAADAMSVVERAYVYPEIISAGAIDECISDALVFYEGDPAKDDTPILTTAEITFKIKNYGKTPAILKDAFTGFGVNPLSTEIGISISEAILGEKETTRELHTRMQVGLTRNQARHILAYTASLGFSGQITFDDIWGNEHTTRFYFVWDKEIKRMALRGIETKTKQKNG